VAADPQSVYDHWDAFTDWAATTTPVRDVELDKTRLRSPSAAPSQVVAIGLNYADHAHATCAFPTCNQRSTRCDLDHTIAWGPGNPASAISLPFVENITG
jgi:hypothetical protein